MVLKPLIPIKREWIHTPTAFEPFTILKLPTLNFDDVLKNKQEAAGMPLTGHALPPIAPLKLDA